MRVRMMAVAMVLVVGTAGAWGQAAEQATPMPSVADTRNAPMMLRTFHLANVTSQAEQNEVLTSLRNLLSPPAKVSLIYSQDTIMVAATEAELGLVQKALVELDKPKKTYRLTYTVTEMDNGKRLGVQHFSMIVTSGQRTTVKQGSKIPISTGSNSFNYESIGMNFDVQVDASSNGVLLRSHVEETSVPEEKLTNNSTQPVIRQSTLEGTAYLAPGKPMMLGSLDVPGSTRHMDVEVVMEQAL